MLLGRSTGGIGTHVVDLTRDLRAEGDLVTVVTDALTATRFGIGDAKRWWPGRSAGVVGSFRRLWWLRSLARESDVVHSHGHQAGLVAVLACARLSTPVVVSQHNAVLTGGPRRWLLNAAQRFVARRAALVTGASSDLVDTARRCGARDPRLAEVPSPRVPELLATLPLSTGARRATARDLLRENGIEVPQEAALVLTIARIAPQKDLGTLVEAAESTRQVQATAPPVWVVVGGGDERLRARLAVRAAERGAPVHFVGPQDDPERWLRAADVFALTSTWEARALVVQEAMAAGVPVVATDTGGLRDLVQGVGELVPVGDPAAVAEAVTGYLTDPAAWNASSAAGRERATSWDDGPATARRWREWYSDLLRMT
jgi:glycosyltransferase involved in cell wall biosynthesis